MSESEAQAQVQARAYFERGRQAAEAGDFDRAIEAYLEGIRLVPDDVAQGHIGLRVLALQRQERGAAGPTPDEVDRHRDAGDSPLEKMLHAEYLLAKDPEQLAYGEAVLKAAVAGGYGEAARWMADLMFLANNNARRPSLHLYIQLTSAYAAVGQFERALAACQRAVRLKPDDPRLVGDLKRLRARLAPGGRRAPNGSGPHAAAGSKVVPQRTRVKTENAAAPDENGGKELEMAVADAGDAQNLVEARSFFAKARTAADQRQYDYAIDMYISGLARAPDALEEGHLPLCELGLQRRGRGGKKPSMMEKVKRMRGKTPLEQMLNAEYLFVKDPDNLAYAEAMLKAAVEGGFTKTAHWIANLIFQTNNALEKPSWHTYLLLKDSYKALGQYDKAVAACQRASRMRPDDKDLADECKNLSAELTMSKGRYDVEGDFRQSIRDRETQARLYAQDRVVKTQDYRASAVEEARQAYAREPELPKNVLNLADALADLQTEQAENEAIQLLEDTYARRTEFLFKERAGVLRMRQLRRQIREAKKTLEAQPLDAEAKAKVAELTARLHATELEHYRLCAENYPTDLAAKYEYGLRLMHYRRYNEAIPLFQEAQKDPRHKVSAMDKVGYCFFMKGWYTDAIEVLTRAIESYEIKDDALAKELRYNLARAYEEQDEKEQALEIYRKIAQLDFSYKDVGARVDRLRSAPPKPDPAAGPPAGE
jgi:tetratricopeptide (TPR) repeat protein